MPTLSGLDFVALQVRDLEVSASFYEKTLGLERSVYSPPNAVVFNTKPIPLAIREPLVDLDIVTHLGHGVSLWFLTEDSKAMLEQLEAANVPVLQGIQPSPFGNTFVFRDPDGYVITVHDKAN